MERIKTIDGLRAFAVVGVIWAHVWMFFGNIPLIIGGIDIHRIISFGGIGVDLFFVISGFCMYLMYQKKAADFSFHFYGDFIVKRWKRIAPAFYFVVLFECIVYLIRTDLFPVKSFLYHLFFINTLDSDNVLSPPYWSLATEWHFYIVLPFLFIKDHSKKFIEYRVWALIILCILLRVWHFSNFKIDRSVTVPTEMIWYRFVEFGWGILAAKRFITGPELPRILRGNIGFLLALCIAFAGRAIMTTEFCLRFGKFGFLVRAFGEPVLTLGFALMILNLLKSATFFQKLISLKPCLFIGKISYSIYLWHWMISLPLSYWMLSYFGKTAAVMELAFVASLAIVIPVAFVSYKFLEAPYFKKNTRKPTTLLRTV
jgi:peptidoglycan/LPS O-acetylase OafA/YrhL